MRIDILGSGNIGAVLGRSLAAKGHTVGFSFSRKSPPRACACKAHLAFSRTCSRIPESGFALKPRRLLQSSRLLGEFILRRISLRLSPSTGVGMPILYQKLSFPYQGRPGGLCGELFSGAFDGDRCDNSATAAHLCVSPCATATASSPFEVLRVRLSASAMMQKRALSSAFLISLIVGGDYGSTN